MDNYATTSGKLLVVGDFNFNFGKTGNQDIFRSAQDNIQNICTATKSTYYHDKIKDNDSNQKYLFRIAHDLLHWN